MDFLQEARKDTGWTAEELTWEVVLGFTTPLWIPPTIEEYTRALQGLLTRSVRNTAYRPAFLWNRVDPSSALQEPHFITGSSKEIRVSENMWQLMVVGRQPAPCSLSGEYEGWSPIKPGTGGRKVLSPDAAANRRYADLGSCCTHIEPVICWLYPVQALIYSMSSNYNALRQAIVLAADAERRLLWKGKIGGPGQAAPHSDHSYSGNHYWRMIYV